MGDINPEDQTQRLSPWHTDLVDTVAESRRITTAIMNSNPLINATVDEGLMKWRGVYSPALHPGDDSSYLWIGEFAPNDPVTGEPQRGFLLNRDDPIGARALWVHDPTPSGTLRQVITVNDADNRRLFSETKSGGLGYPRSHVPMYPMINDIESSPDRWVRTAINGAKPGENRRMFRGVGNMTGSRFYYQAMLNSNGPTYRYWLVLQFHDGTTWQSDNHDGSTADYMVVDQDFSGQPELRGGQVRVEVWGTVLSGTDFTWHYPQDCYLWSYDA